MAENNVQDELHTLVEQFQVDRSIATPQQAFPFWFMEEIEDLSQEEAADAVVDGPNDGGIDALYLDDESGLLYVYQMKYAETRAVALAGFRDLNRAVAGLLTSRPEFLGELQGIRCVLVTSFKADEDFERERKAQQAAIKRALTRAGHRDVSSETSVEVFDLSKFAQLLNRIFGVELTAKFYSDPVYNGNAVLGLIDARDVAEHVGTEELLAFNIRGFLKLRKGSINWGISETLKNDDARPDFWQYNNGLVCICTDFELDGQDCAFENFTIVNGAQTINTIANYLSWYQTENDREFGQPIWTVIKVVKLAIDDVETAIKLTKTSNNQNAASNSDIRAVDPQHGWMRTWLDDLGYAYIYRRGITGGGDSQLPKVKMKDLAQSYIAFSGKTPDALHPLPHVAFARAGSIFGDETLYEAVFPREKMTELNSIGTREARLDFTKKRLLPFLMLDRIRKYLATRAIGPSQKWRSIAFEMLAMYAKMFEALEVTDEDLVLERLEAIMDSTNPDLYTALVEFAIAKSMEIPKAFKTTSFLEAIEKADWLDTSPMAAEIQRKIDAAIGPRP